MRMISRLTGFLALLVVLSCSTVPALAAASSPAPVDNTSKGQVCQGIAVTGARCGSDSNKVYGLIGDIVDVLSVIVGLVAVIMLVVAAFKYITSGGESSKVSEAKSTLLYAIIGLFIAVLAQFLVHFVVTGTQNGLACGADKVYSTSAQACVAGP